MRPDRKRITCFICGLSSGGAEHQISILSNLLTKNGEEVTLVTFADVEDHYDLSEGIRRVRIAKGCNRLVKLIGVFFYFLFTRSHCVISFGQRENLLCLIPLLFRPKIKIIAGERNFTKGRKSAVEKILMTSLYYRADYIVPNSFSQRDHILSQKSMWENKVKTITNYTDISLYSCSEIINNIKPKIGIFARYSEQKNYVRFADAIQILKKEFGAIFKVEWFGSVSQKGAYVEDYIKFKAIIDEKELSDVLILHDHVKDVPSMMSKYDAICLPSMWEGFSNTISEAICCGKPMIVSDVSDNSIMVRDGVNGFIFNPYDIDDICNAFRRYFNTSQYERMNMAQSSRKIAEKLFSEETFIEAYLTFIYE